MKNKYLLLFLPLTMALSLTSCGNESNFDIKDSFLQDTDVYNHFLDDSKNLEFQTIVDNENFTFAFKENNDVLSIYDKSNNYTWKTGIDMPTVSEEFCSLLPRGERPACYAANSRVEGDMVDTYIARANSLISLEVFRENPSGASVSYFGSSLEGVSSILNAVDGDANHFKFAVDYTQCKSRSLDIKVVVDLYFNSKGYTIEIKNCNITGSDSRLISNIEVTPFLGASGGIELNYDDELREYVRSEKTFINGYSLLPDGAGSIIPFANNVVPNLSAYRSYVYGQDPAQLVSNTRSYNGYTGIKNATLPVFGIAHTDFDAAFVAYATSGEEYLSINSVPDNSRQLQYNFTYPSFNLNFEYTQIYNQAGNSYSTLASNRNEFDLALRYDFLSGDDANYFGMAKDYRNYLLDNNKLSLVTTEGDLPVRLDFILADAESALVGNNEVIVTTANQVGDILKDVHDDLSISNVVSSLQGWQKGGKAIQNPSHASFSGSIGSRSDFKNMFEDVTNLGYDVSFSENYGQINSHQMAYLNNAVKHINGYYCEYLDYTASFSQSFGYSRADRAYDFVVAQNKRLSKRIDQTSMTVDGISSILSSNHDNMSRSVAKQYISNAFKYLKDANLKVNAVKPNAYLLEHVDRYFDIDVFDSSLLIESETVPFIEIVLNGTMDLFAKYSNFSFYDDSSVLRMIDFNVLPSFILTNESPYDLLTTNSWSYCSTQYSQYKTLISSIYNRVNGVLKQVVNSEWQNREVLDNGLTINSYANGKKVIINYSSSSINYDGKIIAPISCEVM